MAGIGKRLLNSLDAEDEAVNSLFGGSPQETISGTVGRAAEAGKWWAIHVAQPIINLGAFVVAGQRRHCQQIAAAEAARRAALADDRNDVGADRSDS